MCSHMDFELFEWVKDINLFACKVVLRKKYKGQTKRLHFVNLKDIEGVMLLESLQNEGMGEAREVLGPASLKVKINYTPFLTQ